MILLSVFSTIKASRGGLLAGSKKKEAGQKKILKALSARTKTPAKLRTVLVNKMKVVHFIRVNISEGVVETLVKQSSGGGRKNHRELLRRELIDLGHCLLTISLSLNLILS
jgi:hypothetical protein